MQRASFQKRGLMAFCLAASVFASAAYTSAAAAEESAGQPSVFRKDNLAAWCIVPFDASKRGPQERAEMLQRLGLKKLAYDWRAEHVPAFEEELSSLESHGIELTAFWSPMSESPGYLSMMRLLKEKRWSPQIWMVPPSAAAESNRERIELNAKAMLPYVKTAHQLGSKFGLYNHGGWSGEPETMIQMVQWLRQATGSEDVGIVYSFHHGHEHLDQFPEAFKAMTPYLFCVNLNGMTVGGEKILPLGKGREDARVLRIVRDSGYRGPIGVLDHRNSLDAELSLRENLDGLATLLEQIGDKNALATFER